MSGFITSLLNAVKGGIGKTTLALASVIILLPPFAFSGAAAALTSGDCVLDVGGVTTGAATTSANVTQTFHVQNLGNNCQAKMYYFEGQANITAFNFTVATGNSGIHDGGQSLTTGGDFNSTFTVAFTIVDVAQPAPFSLRFTTSAINNWNETLATGDTSTYTYSPSAPAVIPIPDSPTLTGTAGNAQNILNWNSVTNATAYELYRGGVKIVDGTPTTFTDVSLTNGTNYAYTVKAKNTTGTSAVSNNLTLTPTAPYVAPVATAYITPEHVTLLALLLTFYVSVKFLGLFVYRENL